MNLIAMNKGRLVLGIGLIALAAAVFVISSSANLNFLGMDASGDAENQLTTIDNVRGIHSIKADGVVDVHISMSDTERVRYVFNGKRFNNTSTFNDGVLRISFPTKQKGFKLFDYSSGGVDVYVSVKTLQHIQMNGVGAINTKGMLQTDEIKVVNEGTGSMDLELDATKIKGKNSGVGSLDISGTADTATLANQGVGSVNAQRLITQVMDARNDGVGSMEVYAEKEIKLRNSGVGSIRYSGDAAVTSKRSEGIGSISKR